MFYCNEDENKNINLKIVALKNMFNLEQSQQNNFFEDLELDIREEVGKIGEIHFLKIFENNPMGIILIKFN